MNYASTSNIREAIKFYNLGDKTFETDFSFSAADNPYTNKEFFKICEDYGVSHDPMKYRGEKFYWTYQRGVRWQDDYIGPDSMTFWITEKSHGFTNVGLLRISESVRAYAYLILSS